MLTNMRKSTNNPIIKFVLFGLLILAFGSWGITDYLQIQPTDDPAASVGDVDITTYDLYENYQRKLSRLQITQIEPEQARLLGLADQVLQSMIEQTVFDAESASLGLTTDDATLAAAIRSNPIFRNELGQFDRLRFEQILAANGLTESMFAADLREETTRAQLLDAVTAGLQAPTQFVDKLFAYYGEHRIAETFVVSIDTTTAVASPAESDLQAYYDENQGRFEAPEFRKVTYLAITPDTVVQSIEVNEDRVRAEYDDRQGEFTVTKRRRVLRILVDDEETATAVVQRLSAGEAFAAVAQDVSGQDEAAIDLGLVTRDQIPDPALAEAAFALEAESVSQPVQGLFGWYVVTTTETEPGSTRSFEEVRDQIRDELAREVAVNRVYELARDVEDLVSAGTGLEATADQLGLKTMTVDALSPGGDDEDGTPIPDLPSGRFLEVAFEQAQGEDGFLTETADDGFFVLRVDAVTAPRLKALEEVRDTVIESWEAEQRRKTAEERAQSLAQAIRDGDAIGTVAQQAGAEATLSEPFSRRDGGFGGPLPPGLVADLFATTRPGEIAVGEAPDGFVVAQLKEIQAATTASVEGLRDQVNDQLVAAIAGDLVEQFNRVLRDKHPVTVNSAMVDLVYDGLGAARR